MPQKFRTRIVEIEATQFTGDNWNEIIEWTERSFRPVSVLDEMRQTHKGNEITAEVFDKLHSAWIGVAPGQWIVRGVKGEYYPCDDETFHWKYEEIVESEHFEKVTAKKECPYKGRHQGNAVFQEGDSCRHCGWTL